jgi:hypothetical protein
MLVGREAECARLDSQAGRSGVLVISLHRQIGIAVVASNPAGELLYVECASALVAGVRRNRWTGSDADAAYGLLMRLPVQSVTIDAISNGRGNVMAALRSLGLCAAPGNVIGEDGNMIVTMATFQETGEQLEEGMRHVREEVVPSIRVAKGVRAAYWMVDRGNGKRLSVTVWDDADAAATAMPGVMASIKRLREESGRTEPQRSPDYTERFEVFAQV